MSLSNVHRGAQLRLVQLAHVRIPPLRTSKPVNARIYEILRSMPVYRLVIEMVDLTIAVPSP